MDTTVRPGQRYERLIGEYKGQAATAFIDGDGCEKIRWPDGREEKYPHEGLLIRGYWRLLPAVGLQEEAAALTKRLESALKREDELVRLNDELTAEAAALTKRCEALQAGVDWAGELLRIARGAVFKLGVFERGSDLRLAHEARMFALAFNRRTDPPPPPEHGLCWTGTGDVYAWLEGERTGDWAAARAALESNDDDKETTR